MRSALVALAALFCLSLAPRADTIVLTDGRVFDEISISQEDGGVLIHFEHGDVLVPNEQIETLISTSTDLIPRTEEEKARFEKGQVRYKGKWVKISQRDRLVKKDLAALREQVENAKNRRLWRNRRILETKNFIFESTCPDAVLENYADLCETYFSEFVKSWKIRKPKGLGKLTLKFFIDQEAFMQVTGMGSGVLGFFRFIEPFELCIFYDRLDPEGTEQVLYHEVGHYLMRLVEDGFKYPHWPGESISEFYSASVWDPVKKKLEWGGIHEGRSTVIHQDIEAGDWVTVDRLLTGAQERTFHDYTWGWSFVHYLLNNPKYAKNFRKFFVAMAKANDIDRQSQDYGRTVLRSVDGRSMKEGFMKYMKIKGDDGLRKLQDEWYDHIKEKLQVTTARGLADAGRRAERLGRNQRAKRLYEEAIEAGADKSLTFHRYASILDQLGEHEKARENWEKAIRLDPLIADYYVQLGESHLLHSGAEDSFEVGEEYLLLALDIEPDNFYLDQNLDRLLQAGRKIKNRKGSKPKGGSDAG